MPKVKTGINTKNQKRVYNLYLFLQPINSCKMQIHIPCLNHPLAAILIVKRPEHRYKSKHHQYFPNRFKLLQKWLSVLSSGILEAYLIIYLLFPKRKVISARNIKIPGTPNARGAPYLLFLRIGVMSMEKNAPRLMPK